MATDTRKLKDQAQKAVNKGKHTKALDLYLALEAAEPADGGWARRAANMYQRLGRDQEHLLALQRAADKYGKAGFLVKAIAVCKMILADEPGHVATQEKLAALYAERGIPAAAKPAATAGPSPVPPRKRTLPPGAPLDSVALSDIVPGATPAGSVAGAEASIQDIPLELELDTLLEQAQGAVEQPGAEPIDIELIDDDENAQQAARRLQETPFFAALGPKLLEMFIDKVTLVELAAGEVLFRQGDGGDALYVVAEGEVAVLSEGPPRVQLSRLCEGDFFGEIALVTEQPRSATIEAVDGAELLAIDRDTVGDLIHAEPNVLRLLLRFLRDRLLNTLVHTNPLFNSYGGAERQTLAEKFRFLEGEQSAVLIEQGGRANGLYILLAGQAEVLVQTGDATEPTRLATLGPGDVCGEMSLLANADAVATVRLTSKAFVLKLPADVFRQVIMTHPQVLMFVGELADERRRQLEAISVGNGDYEVAHLELL